MPSTPYPPKMTGPTAAHCDPATRICHLCTTLLAMAQLISSLIPNATCLAAKRPSSAFIALEIPSWAFTKAVRAHQCSTRRRISRPPVAALSAAAMPAQHQQPVATKHGGAPTDIEYDAVIVGSGMGGLTTACQMAAKGAKVVVLEK